MGGGGRCQARGKHLLAVPSSTAALSTCVLRDSPSVQAPLQNIPTPRIGSVLEPLQHPRSIPRQKGRRLEGTV